MAYARRGLGAGLGESYYRCSNGASPWTVFKGSDHSSLGTQYGSDTAINGIDVINYQCNPDNTPAGTIQSYLLQGQGKVDATLGYLASLPTWALIGGSAAALFLLAKVFGGHR